jgi:hypothetical protein
MGVRGATVGTGESNSAVGRLNRFPLVSTEEAPIIALNEAVSAQLAGLAVTLPTISGDSLRGLAGMQDELLKALEKVELPVAQAVGAGSLAMDRDLPWPTIVAFSGGAFMLLCLCVFGGALLRMSMEDARRTRRMSRRYVP